MYLWDSVSRLSSHLGPANGVAGDNVHFATNINNSEVWVGYNGGAVCLLPESSKPRLDGIHLSYGSQESFYPEITETVNIQTKSMVTLDFDSYFGFESSLYKIHFTVHSKTGDEVASGFLDRVHSHQDIIDSDDQYIVSVSAYDQFLNKSDTLIYEIQKTTPFFQSNIFYVIMNTTGISLLIIILGLTRRHWSVRNQLLKERESNNIKLKSKNEELRLALNEANAAKEAKGRFLANMSHELRTPMNGIIGMAELQGLTDLSNQQRDYNETIAESAKGLMRVINDILDFSKLEAQRLKFENIPFSLEELVRDVLKMHKVIAQKKGVELVSVIEKESKLGVIGDPLRVRQVLDNLLSNAIKFTTNGAVTLKFSTHLLSPEELNCQITVSDEGRGMTKAQLERIFSPFEQAEAETTRQYGGTGLGLAITKEILDLMDGDISVETEENVGSKFQIEFSLDINQQTTSHSVESTKSLSSAINIADSCYSNDSNSQPLALSRITDGEKTGNENEVTKASILLVEDNLVNQRVITKMIQKIGYQVDIAKNGLEAVEMVNNENCPYKMIFMDCQMHFMDGFEAAKQIRQFDYRRNENQSIIALSANTLEKDKRKCLEAGMDDFIPKPVSVAQIRQVIEKRFLLKTSLEN